MVLTGNGTPDVYKILGGARTRQADYDYSYANNDINQGDLYIGHSGDPWGASSARNYDKDTYVRISSNNATANNTKAQFA